jgi:formylglycine-generating enzyme required for sulfatase activity
MRAFRSSIGIFLFGWLCGGAWGYPPDYLRTVVRGRQGQGYRYVNAGIRIARSLEQ